eukprot:225056-Prorocentrum_minimum.AAC.1
MRSGGRPRTATSRSTACTGRQRCRRIRRERRCTARRPPPSLRSCWCGSLARAFPRRRSGLSARRPRGTPSTRCTWP